MELSLPLTDATALQDALQGGRASARDVAAAALRRARAAESDQHGPALGAFVHLESGEAADERATALENTTVVCASKDLPFAAERFCSAEGIENVSTGSAFRSSLGEDYGVTMTDGPLKGLLSRAVVVIDEQGKVVYTQQVSEVTDEPDYDAALAALA